MKQITTFIAIAAIITSCTSDDDNSCKCVKETYSKEIKHLYDTPASESKCTGDNSLRVDEFRSMYRYTCK